MPNTDTYGFKNDLPVSAVMELVSMVRSGTITSDPGCALQHAGWALGCVGKRFDKHSSDPLFAVAPATFGAEMTAEPETIEECCAAIEQAVSDKPEEKGLVGASPIVEALLAKLIKLILEQLLP